MSGWIKLHRTLINWEWYTDHNTCRLFIHCLLRANHSDSKWRGQTLNRGQFLTSLESLSNETGLSVSQIRTGFRKLKSTNEIASSSQARSRVITVLKYDSYQSDDKVTDKLVTGSSQADGSEIATDKNVRSKECKNDKKNNIDFSSWPNEPDQQIWNDYKQLRRSKKAPITQTVINAMSKQIAQLPHLTVDEILTECVSRGWQGLKAEWFLNNSKFKSSQQRTPAQDSEMEAWLANEKEVSGSVISEQ